MGTPTHRPVRPASIRHARRRRVERLAATQEGVVSRRQVYAAGLTRAEVRANVRAARWQAVGRHVVVVTTGPLTDEMRWWAAVLSGGPRAQLDGASSLVAAGLKGFDVARHRVSVPRGAPVFRDALVDVRQTRHWSSADLAPGLLPRTRSDVAAVRGALWAVSHRQGALLVTMAVQQGLVTPEAVGVALLRIKKAPRLAQLREVVSDLLGGARSLAELDFARLCRERGLPEPDRQVVRK
ncbi:MAG: hypothetical protein LT071_05145, partial [Nocardioides sp.]|nr:hypothetical protein [Nocardioides sp.]